MAKLFYTIDEAAARLGKSESDLQKMVNSGQLEEFKMHDQVHFKRAVIDQLVVDDSDDLVLPGDDDLDLSDSSIKSSPTPAISLNDASGSAIIDDLKFDDDAPTAPASKPSAKSEMDLGMDLGLDLGLDLELDLDEGVKSASAGAKAPSTSSKPKVDASGPIDFGDPIGLVDSADASGIAPAAPAKSSTGSGSSQNLGNDLDLDLGLDLGLDDAPPTKSAPAKGGIDLMGDRRGDSAAAMAASDASGSMAPPTNRRPAPQNDDFLDVGSMTGSGSLSLETVGSGSGMLDDSTDSDQSTVGAALLDDGGDDTFGTGASLGGASGLFAEPTGMDGFDQDSDDSVPMAASAIGGGMVAMQVERVESASSGMGLGLMVGSLVAIVLAALVVMGSRMGGGSALAAMITQDWMMWCGGLAIGTLVAGGIGFFVGKSLE